MTGERQVETSSGPVHIRTLHSLQEMSELVSLQRQIWGFGQPGADLPCPARTLFALSESGGHLAAAFLGDLAVGFSAAWMGQFSNSHKPYLHSQMLGVVKEHRHLNIGYHLKLHQRAFALESGLERIRWTFDPLRTANANLNIRKLGAVICTYHCHYYGGLRSHFTQQLPTDRVWAEWHVSSRRVENRLCSTPPSLDQKPDLTQVNRIGRESRSEPAGELMDYDLDRPDRRLLVEVPDDFDAICQTRPSVALDWREKTREIFRHYFGRGYVIGEFVLLSAPPRRTFYLLIKDPVNEILEATDSYPPGS